MSLAATGPRLLAAAAVVAAVVGCQSAATPAVTPGAGGTASAGPTQVATAPPASPTAPAARALAAQELPPASTAMEAGRYTRRGFEPRITFEVAGGTWRAVQAFTGFFDIQQDVGSPDVIAVQFGRPDGAFGAGGQVVAVDTATAAAAAVQANPGLEILGTSDLLMSGLTGVVLEVENPTAAAEHVQVLRVAPGPLGIDPGRRLWVAFFDTADGLLAIMVGGSVATWDAALLAAEPVLETVTIGQ